MSFFISSFFGDTEIKSSLNIVLFLNEDVLKGRLLLEVVEFGKLCL